MTQRDPIEAAPDPKYHGDPGSFRAVERTVNGAGQGVWIVSYFVGDIESEMVAGPFFSERTADAFARGLNR